jgi:hypothetical protein
MNPQDPDDGDGDEIEAQGSQQKIECFESHSRQGQYDSEQSSGWFLSNQLSDILRCHSL